MADTGPKFRLPGILQSGVDARARRQRRDPAGWFLAISGLELSARALGNLPDASGNGPEGSVFIEELEAAPRIWTSDMRLRSPVAHQVAFLVDNDDLAPEHVAELFWSMLATMRLRTSGYFSTPAFSNKSWDVIDGCDPDEVVSYSLSRETPRWWPNERPLVDSEDWTWVYETHLTVWDLRQDRRFHLVLEAFVTSFDEPDPRMAAAKLWSGIEATFGVSAELRFRVAMYAAVLLEEPGSAREDRYRAVLKLYDVRSKVVHGADLEMHEVVAHVARAQELLRGLIVKCIDLKGVPALSFVEGRLFGV